MAPRQWKPLLISTTLFLLILAVSAVLFTVTGDWRRRVLFFPGMDTVRLSGESRFLPRSGELDEGIRLLAEEAVLGPADPTLRRYLPKELEIQSVVVRHGVAYVSVSHHLLEGTESYRGTVEDALQALANTILYNFHRLRRLYLLVDGQLPRGRGEDGFAFSRDVLQ
jgi:hypothetical protein